MCFFYFQRRLTILRAVLASSQRFRLCELTKKNDIGCLPCVILWSDTYLLRSFPYRKPNADQSALVIKNGIKSAVFNMMDT